MKARHEPMVDGSRALAVELASRLIGPDDDDLLNENDDFVTYARSFHPAELKVLEARHHVRVAAAGARSEPLVTFHLSAAFTAIIACSEIMRYHKGDEAYKAWWSRARKCLNDDAGWHVMKRLRNRLVHQGLDRFKVHQRISYIERPDGAAVECDVACVEIDGRRIDAPFEMCGHLINSIHDLVKDARAKGFLQPLAPDGRTLHLDFVKVDAEGNRRRVSPSELETTKHLKELGLIQSLEYKPKASNKPSPGQ